MLICKDADNAIRWREGERLNHLYERRCDEFDARGDGDHQAVFTDNTTYTFRDIDKRANQLARHLIAKRINSGDRVGVMFDKTVDTYIALLAVLKANAAYVPLDAGFPKERINFILGDAKVRAVVTLSEFLPILADSQTDIICLDTAITVVEANSSAPLTEEDVKAPTDELAYIIYTSGTTGNPKGVAIEHSSICNFVRVAAEVYCINDSDRVYQGMTIAFDFSVEELWVPLIAGATLIPGKPGTSLVGYDLASHLRQNRVTVLCCVPTLLATIEDDLPCLRILLVSGEPCPQNLVTRWHKPGRTILNAYGPTECTVTCTLTKLYPEKPVTIGSPLPTYTIAVLKEDAATEVPDGQLGEVCVAGIGLARGYLNQPNLTEEKFIFDFLDLPNNPSKRIYRTGDLGLINSDGEIEFYGRIDTQVKIRGYRIELSEIESALMEVPQIAQAVVNTWEPEPGRVELVAYYSLSHDATELPVKETWRFIRERLPSYMVPAYLEHLPVIPMTPSHKANRKKLPPPSGQRFVAQTHNYIEPSSQTEKEVTVALQHLLQIEGISVDANFFKDLGAHSLLMAQFAARIRKIFPLSDLSMRDIYLNPTVQQLALHLDAEPSTINQGNAPRRTAELHKPTDGEYFLCGFLQALFFIAYGLFAIWTVIQGVKWSYGEFDNLLYTYLRIIAFTTGLFFLFTAIPILAKWTLIGTWKTDVIPIWSLKYFRFWLIKTLTQSSPMAAFSGSPIYNSYLRLLGAKIGTNVTILSNSMPACTDLFSVGDNTIICKDTLLPGYTAEANRIYTGPIHIGASAFIGVGSVVDIKTKMNDGSQLGHSSSLQSGEELAPGTNYHGSPAKITNVDYCSLPRRDGTAIRRALYTAFQLISIFFISGPLLLLFLYLLLPPLLTGMFGGTNTLKVDDISVFSLAAILAPASFAMMFLYLFLSFTSTLIVPRILRRFLVENKTYPLFGVHYYIHNLMVAASNSRFVMLIFGDSSAIVYYLNWLGYKLNRIIQTGSNFGTHLKHDNPFLCDVGTGTMVSDGLSMINIEMSNSSFCISKVKIGEHNYLGNNIHYPAGAKVGRNCLLGTKVMVPIDGEIREDTGLLGSPPFEIPRAIDRDRNFSTALDSDTIKQRIKQKNRSNFMTVTKYLLAIWFYVFLTLLLGSFASLAYFNYGILAITPFGIIASMVTVLYFIIVERASLRFGRLSPKLVSIYDKYFWFHENHWKFVETPLEVIFPGTPFRTIIMRMLGIRMGKKVFDDGCNYVEKTLIKIGDYTNLNQGSIVQGHSLEEGVFKSDYITIGEGCSIGCGAFVHYGVTIKDGVVIAIDSFVMKGETLESNSIWRGNPARVGASGRVFIEPAQ